MIENNILERAQKLQSIAKYPAKFSTIAAMEKMDAQIGRGVTNALSQCRKIKMGKIPFSALFQSLQQQRRLWLLVYKKKIGQRISSRLIRRLSKAIGYHNPLTHTLNGAAYRSRTTDNGVRPVPLPNSGGVHGSLPIVVLHPICK